MERAMPTESAQRLDAALARLDSWIDGSAQARPAVPAAIVPQLPVPVPPAEGPTASAGRAAVDIAMSALVSGATTATTLAVLVFVAMLLLPQAPRPSLVP